MIIYVQNITDDEIRITFSLPVSLNNLDNVSNYVLSPSGVSVKQVLIPSTDEIYHIDLYVIGLRLGTEYALTISNLSTASGSTIPTQSILFTAVNTKSANILSGLPQMYDTRIQSTLRHIMIAIGMADNEIGG